MMIRKAFLAICLFAVILSPTVSFGQDDHRHDEETHAEDHDSHGDHEHEAVDIAGCGQEYHGDHHEGEEHEMSYTDEVMLHISDANEIHLFGDTHIPLPCILYSKEHGLKVVMSSAFEHGHKVIDGYVLDHGDVKRIACTEAADKLEHVDFTETRIEGEKEYNSYAVSHGVEYKLEKPATLFNLGSASWFDFSITKNIASMILATILLFVIFGSVKRGYEKRDGQAPKGVQSFFEPIFTFMRDEVVAPSIGPKYERYMPFIMSLFFFILFCNLLGLIPFIGGANITGNIATTAALAFITFLIVNLNGNKHYWQHIFWMPDTPKWVRFLLAPIEFIGIFIKPFTLLIRLFANITAGHILVLVLVGLIFIMGKNGESIGGAIGGGVIGISFALFINILELFVAFLQAFIFALLASLYIGSAVADHHDHGHEHDEVPPAIA